MLNTFVTKELTSILQNTWVDKPVFYRICLIPPIGSIVFFISTLLIVLTFLFSMIIDVWK
jgi:hypothetical protein